MKISELLNVHGGLVSMAGGPYLPNKLGKFNYGVIKNIRKLESDVLKPFQEARQKLAREHLEKYPESDKLPDDQRQAAEAEFNAAINLLLAEEGDFTPHLMDVGVLELCTVAEANAILPLVREEGGPA